LWETGCASEIFNSHAAVVSKNAVSWAFADGPGRLPEPGVHQVPVPRRRAGVGYALL